MSIFKTKPFLIAEIGVNYYDIAKKEKITNMDAAKLMIKEAKESGCDGVKFQTYKAETIASRNSPAYWDLNEEPTKSQFELFKKFDSFGNEEYKELANYCKKLGIKFLSTPFDFESVDYLDEYMDVYKISSSDLNNIPFIKKIASKKKPIILSTGASYMKEIDEAIKAIKDVDSNIEMGLLHCVLSYPTKYEDANLLMIKNLKESYPTFEIGYSDHTKPDDEMLTLTTAYLYGANIIEKHFTLDKTLIGNDHYHAMDPDDVRKFKRNIKFINKINGQYEKIPLECEKESRLQARRSIIAKNNIPKNSIIKESDLTYKRPGTGISPNKIEEIIGKKTKIEIKADDIIEYEMLQ